MTQESDILVNNIIDLLEESNCTHLEKYQVLKYVKNLVAQSKIK